MIALRLKVVNRQIPEVETLVARNERSAQNFEKIGTPNHLFQEAVPPAERMSREDLIKTANMYFTGMQQNDGKGVYPFTDDCNRIENGSPTTNVKPADGKPAPDPKTATNYSSAWSCKEQFESGLAAFRDADSRPPFVAVDPERGMVFSFIFFDHEAGNTRTFQTPDGRTVTAGPEPALDLGTRRIVQNREGQAPSDRGDHGSLALRDEFGLEQLGRRNVDSGPRYQIAELNFRWALFPLCR